MKFRREIEFDLMTPRTVAQHQWWDRADSSQDVKEIPAKLTTLRSSMFHCS
jgi:hypothetical protein